MKVVKQKKENIPEKVWEVADGLHSAAIHVLRRVRKHDVSAGIGPAQLSALSVLVFAGPKTLGELAAAEQVKPPTMSRIVTSLERSGLIAVNNDAGDSRRVRIQATARGEQLLQQARKRRIEDLASQVQLLPRNELETLAEALVVIGKLLSGSRSK